MATRREAQRSGIQPRTYTLCHHPPLPTNYLQQRDLSSRKHPFKPQQTARTHSPRKDCLSCEKSIFVCYSDLFRLYPLINEPADPSRRDRGQRSHSTACTRLAGLRCISDATGSILPTRLRSTVPYRRGDPFLWSVPGPRTDLYADGTRFKWPIQTQKRMGGDVEKPSIDGGWLNW